MAFSRGTAPIVINWHGPLSSVKLASQAAKDGEVEEGLYLAIGKRDLRGQHYVGASIDIPQRLNEGHHVLGGLGEDQLEIWIGVVASPKIWTTSKAQHSTAVHLAEHATAYFLELTENQKLTKTPPDRSVILLNRWYHADKPDYKRRPDRGHKDWPDVIEFDKESGCYQLAWFDDTRHIEGKI